MNPNGFYPDEEPSDSDVVLIQCVDCGKFTRSLGAHYSYNRCSVQLADPLLSVKGALENGPVVYQSAGVENGKGRPLGGQIEEGAA